MIDNKLTPIDVRNIMLLNSVMNSNECYRAILGNDPGCINHINIHICTRLLELNCYLVKNYKIIPKLFDNDIHNNYNKLNHLINLMDNNNTPISTILKSVGIEQNKEK